MKKLMVILFPALLLLWACEPTGMGNLKSGRTTTDNAVTANINVGVEYMRRKEFEKALEKLERARDLDPGYYQSYSMLGVLYQRLGENQQAEENFKKALKLNGTDAPTLNNYGQFQCDTGHFNEAMQSFKRAAGNPLYETPEIPLTNAGLCAMRNKEEKGAEQNLRKALQRNPKFTQALLPMIQISYDDGNYLSARGYLQRYLEVGQQTSRTLWLGIQIEKQLGDDNAVSSYALLLRNNFPDSRETELLNKSGIR